MALGTEHHCLSMALYHLAFPGHFACEISQLSDVMDFHLSELCSTPLALMSEEAFPQLRPVFVHHRIGFQIQLLGCVRTLLELSG